MYVYCAYRGESGAILRRVWHRAKVIKMHMSRSSKGAGKTLKITGEGGSEQQRQVVLRQYCGHLRFSPFENEQPDDDVVKFEKAKFGRKQIFTNSNNSLAWCYHPIRDVQQQ